MPANFKVECSGCGATQAYHDEACSYCGTSLPGAFARDSDFHVDWDHGNGDFSAIWIRYPDGSLERDYPAEIAALLPADDDVTRTSDNFPEIPREPLLDDDSWRRAQEIFEVLWWLPLRRNRLRWLHEMIDTMRLEHEQVLAVTLMGWWSAIEDCRHEAAL